MTDTLKEESRKIYFATVTSLVTGYIAALSASKWGVKTGIGAGVIGTGVGYMLTRMVQKHAASSVEPTKENIR